MFGYVTPFKPDLKIREFEAYKAVYCGLCKRLGKRFGPFSRLTLSYDFAFLGMFALAVHNKLPNFTPCRCAVNPFKKKTCIKDCDELDFSADAAMIMLYYKVVDNIHDSGFFKKIAWSLLRPFASSAHKKAARRSPLLDKVITDALKTQETLENNACASVDQAADPTATALASVCALLDENRQTELSRFGYLLGRWVYLVDALDDIEDDLRTHNYNVFVQNGIGKTPAELRQEAVYSLNMTIAELQLSLDRLNITVFKPILDNVVYSGLADTQKRICNR